MVTIRPVERAARTTSDVPVVNDYTDLVFELRDLEDKRAKGAKRQEAVIEQDEVSPVVAEDGTDVTVRTVRRDINTTARTHGLSLNFRSAKGEWPIVFSISTPRAADAEDETPAETPGATGKAA